MADAYSQFLNLTKPEVGASRDTWGNKENDNIDKIDAWAKATDTLAKAAFPKAGGALTGAIEAPGVTVSGAAGQVVWASRDAGVSFTAYAAGPAWRLYNGAEDVLRVASSGSVWAKGIGDVGQAIADAAAAGAAALAQAVKKAGDTMTGQLVLSSGNGVRLQVPGKADWLVRAIDGNRLQFCDGPATVEYFSVGPGGDISTRQFGDLNNRIEQRGADNQNAAVNRCVVGMRWAFVGDEGITTQFNGGMREAFGGSAITGRASILSGDQNDIIVGVFRYRQLQFLIPNQGWVASYFA